MKKKFEYVINAANTYVHTKFNQNRWVQIVILAETFMGYMRHMAVFKLNFGWNLILPHSNQYDCDVHQKRTL